MKRIWIVLVGMTALLAACSTTTPAVPKDNPPPTLAGTAWKVTKIGGAETLADRQPTLKFADGQAGGNSGCNHFGGEYTQNGAELTFGELAQTAMLCSPDDVMTQEQNLSTALAAVTQVRVAGDGLELVDAGGKTVLTLATLTHLPLAGTTWQLSGVITKDAISSPVADSVVTLQITDGKLSGKACNSFNGTAEISGDNITVGPLASTRMACPTEELGAQETTVLSILEAAKTFAIDVNTLRITADDGRGLEFTAAK